MPFAFDAHADTAQRFLDLGEHFDDPASGAELTLDRARRGGLGGQIFAVWVDPEPFPGDAAWPRALAVAGAIDAEVARRPDALRACRTGADVRAAADAGRFAVLLGVEGAHALGGEETALPARLERLGDLARRGVRYLALTWNNSNDLAGSAHDGGRERGLSDAGREVARACLRLGVLLDLSHLSDPSAADLIELARAAGRPVIASHSSARALSAVGRNLTDEQLRAVADSGGVAGVNFYPVFLDDDFRARATAATSTPEVKAAMAAARAAHRGDAGRASLAAFAVKAAAQRRALPIPSVERVVDHLVHMLAVAGEDHVGLGSDFDGIGSAPAGLEDPSGLPRLHDALVARAVAPRVADKVFAANWLRVLDT